MSSSGIAIGLNKGFPVTKRVLGARPSQAKARLSKRTKNVRALISEVVGMNPYERRLLDMLKTGGAGAEKRMYKFAKRRLGTHKRALKKREQIKESYGKIRAKAAADAKVAPKA
ncbi:ribosomal protein L36e [Ochromonadaceae sp. CCMP2298]|nr:ribosomal protein L36e [Ochromonadaceae sp. CCMP2298]|mmetsp:Transcript_6797/g.15108  ORF Transcript_6797/g.15108 Transcript_6797/m.15108 type:complete len:114 (+) Transcript_6797:38-379(+)